MSAPSLRGWTPVWLGATAEGAVIDWFHFGPERFVDPFFEDTVRRTAQNPAHVLFRQRTSLPALEAFARESPGLKPSAFIFHLSRCGSTLLSQMLAASARNLAISEAPPLDSILFGSAYAPEVDRAIRLGWIRAMVSALGQPRYGEEHFFLKLDSWHVMQLPLILEAFPEVPWIFLYRDPLDVLLSHERLRGSQMIPSVLPPQVFAFDPPWTPAVSLSEYAAWVLKRISEAAIAHAGIGHGRLVHYAELKETMPDLCTHFFGLNYTGEELARMAEAAKYYSKEPTKLFVDDSARRRAEAPPQLSALYDRYLAEPYRQLEALRADQASLR